MRRQLLRPMKGYLSTCGGETACAGVSANSVTINDVQNGGITVPGTSSGGGGGGLSTGAIVGIVIGALAGLLLLCEQFQPPADHAACATFELRVVVSETDPPAYVPCWPGMHLCRPTTSTHDTCAIVAPVRLRRHRFQMVFALTHSMLSRSAAAGVLLPAAAEAQAGRPEGPRDRQGRHGAGSPTPMPPSLRPACHIGTAPCAQLLL